MAKTKADKAKMHAKAKARASAKAKQRTKKYQAPKPHHTQAAQLVSRIAPHTTMAYARYMGESMLEFDEDGQTVYLDTGNVVKNFAIYKDQNGVEQMTFSNGETTIFAEYRDDEFVEITEQEFIVETTGEIADIDSIVPQAEAQAVKAVH